MSFSNNNLLSALFLITFLFAASYPLAHGQTDTVLGLRVSGRLCCTPTGNCPGQPVDLVPVRLTCFTNDKSDSFVFEEIIVYDFNNLIRIYDDPLIPGSIIYDLNRIYDDPLISGSIIPGSIIPCEVTVPLPLNATVCPELSTGNGYLVSAVQLAASVSNTSIGLVWDANITGFVRIDT